MVKVRINVIEKNFPIVATFITMAAVNTRLSRIYNIMSVDGYWDVIILNGCMFIITVEMIRRAIVLYMKPITDRVIPYMIKISSRLIRVIAANHRQSNVPGSVPSL
jgi:hypothetical protein